jgi:hypothetical protein
VNDLLQRYLDGGLDRDEAERLLERLERDPALSRELREYERMLAALADVEPSPSQGFTDAVMARIAAGESGGGEGGRARRERHAVATRKRVGVERWLIAASLLLAVALGHVATRWFSDGLPGSTPLRRHSGLEAEIAGAADHGAGTVQFVRLFYVPRDTDVATVEVVGDFNGWSRGVTPLQERDGVWSTVLALPPGSYEYQFLVDGEEWVTDPLAASSRSDGFGGSNAVLDVAS